MGDIKPVVTPASPFSSSPEPDRKPSLPLINDPTPTGSLIPSHTASTPTSPSPSPPLISIEDLPSTQIDRFLHGQRPPARARSALTKPTGTPQFSTPRTAMSAQSTHLSRSTSIPALPVQAAALPPSHVAFANAAVAAAQRRQMQSMPLNQQPVAPPSQPIGPVSQSVAPVMQAAARPSESVIPVPQPTLPVSQPAVQPAIASAPPSQSPINSATDPNAYVQFWIQTAPSLVRAGISWKSVGLLFLEGIQGDRPSWWAAWRRREAGSRTDEKSVMGMIWEFCAVFGPGPALMAQALSSGPGQQQHQHPMQPTPQASSQTPTTSRTPLSAQSTQPSNRYSPYSQAHALHHVRSAPAL